MNLEKLLSIKKIHDTVESGSFNKFKTIIHGILKKTKSDSKLLLLFNNLRVELDLNPVGILNDNEKIEQGLSDKVEERVIAWMKNSSTVDVKDECRLGGDKTCNQGDINSLNITKIKD